MSCTHGGTGRLCAHMPPADSRTVRRLLSAARRLQSKVPLQHVGPVTVLQDGHRPMRVDGHRPMRVRRTAKLAVLPLAYSLTVPGAPSSPASVPPYCIVLYGTVLPQGKEVEYSLRLLPLGGFVAFPDDDPESPFPRVPPLPPLLPAATAAQLLLLPACLLLPPSAEGPESPFPRAPPPPPMLLHRRRDTAGPSCPNRR